MRASDRKERKIERWKGKGRKWEVKGNRRCGRVGTRGTRD